MNGACGGDIARAAVGEPLELAEGYTHQGTFLQVAHPIAFDATAYPKFAIHHGGAHAIQKVLSCDHLDHLLRQRVLGEFQIDPVAEQDALESWHSAYLARRSTGADEAIAHVLLLA